MRFLKNKIAEAKAFKEAIKLKQIQQQQKKPRTPLTEEKTKVVSPKKNIDSEDGKATKNVAQNFGRAICNFATSDIAAPYLIPILEKEKANMKLFKEYMNQAKKRMDGVLHFRETLLINENDSMELKSIKKAFAEIGEVFIKNFSVNWIFHGKVSYKKAYLKYRFKLLRRIKNPELFTYLR